MVNVEQQGHEQHHERLFGHCTYCALDERARDVLEEQKRREGHHVAVGGIVEQLREAPYRHEPHNNKCVGAAALEHPARREQQYGVGKVIEENLSQRLIGERPKHRARYRKAHNRELHDNNHRRQNIECSLLQLLFIKSN